MYDLSVNISSSTIDQNTVTSTPKRSIGDIFKSNNTESYDARSSLPQNSMHMMAYSASCGTAGLTSPDHENEGNQPKSSAYEGSEASASVTQ